MYIIITQKKFFFKKFVSNFTESVKQHETKINIYFPTGILYNKKNKIYFFEKINIWLMMESLMLTR